MSIVSGIFRICTAGNSMGELNERWHLKQLAARHGFNDVVEKEIFRRMMDMHRVATHAFAFPTPTNGLKDIAKYLGFTGVTTT